MPKETIETDAHYRTVAVGWGRDSEAVQLSIAWDAPITIAGISVEFDSLHVLVRDEDQLAKLIASLQKAKKQAWQNSRVKKHYRENPSVPNDFWGWAPEARVAFFRGAGLTEERATHLARLP